ncbi:hypothetical protein [Clostridium nigeriense]|nr:hypothetical protein [Clostridium nigeriense]
MLLLIQPHAKAAIKADDPNVIIIAVTIIISTFLLTNRKVGQLI